MRQNPGPKAATDLEAADRTSLLGFGRGARDRGDLYKGDFGQRWFAAGVGGGEQMEAGCSFPFE